MDTAQNKRITVPIVGFIGEWFAEGVLYASDYLSAGDELEVIISSNGGSAITGLQLFDTFRYLQKKGVKVSGEVIGMADSAASLALAGCNPRKASTIGSAIIHEVSSGYSCGTASDLRDDADMIDVLTTRYATAYSAISGKSVEDCLAVMKAGKMLNASQCLEFGLFTDLVSVEAQANAGKINYLPKMDFLAKMKGLLSPKADAATANITLTATDGKVYVVVTNGESPMIGDPVTDESGAPIEDASIQTADGTYTVSGGKISALPSEMEDKADVTIAPLNPDALAAVEAKFAAKFAAMENSIAEKEAAILEMATAFQSLQTTLRTSLPRAGANSANTAPPPANEGGIKFTTPTIY